jgi:hypothetical protein
LAPEQDPEQTRELARRGGDRDLVATASADALIEGVQWARVADRAPAIGSDLEEGQAFFRALELLNAWLVSLGVSFDMRLRPVTKATVRRWLARTSSATRSSTAASTAFRSWLNRPGSASSRWWLTSARGLRAAADLIDLATNVQWAYRVDETGDGKDSWPDGDPSAPETGDMP